MAALPQDPVPMRPSMSQRSGVPPKRSAASPGGSSPGGSSPGGSSPGGSSPGGSRLGSVRLAASLADFVASISQLGSILQVELIDLERGLSRGGIRGNPSVQRLHETAKGLAFLGVGASRGSSASPGGSSPGGSSPGGSSPGGSSPGGSSPGGSSGGWLGLAALSDLSEGLLDAGRATQRDVSILRDDLARRGLTTNPVLDRIQQLAIAMAIVDPGRIGRLGRGVGVVGQSPGGSSPGGSSPGGSSPGGSSPGGSSPGGSSGAAFGLERLYGATTRLSELARGLGRFGDQGQSPGGSSPGGSSPGGSSPGGSSPGGSSIGGFMGRFGGQSPVGLRLFESLINLASALHGVSGFGALGGLSVTSPREANRGRSMAPKSPPRGRG
jgi:hypothetical protein